MNAAPKIQVMRAIQFLHLELHESIVSDIQRKVDAMIESFEEQIKDARRQVSDLQAANNRLLERARAAEQLVKAS